MDPLSAALTPLDLEPDGQVNSLLAGNGTLSLGGFFDQVSGQTSPYFAQVDPGSGAVLWPWTPCSTMAFRPSAWETEPSS